MLPRRIVRPAASSAPPEGAWRPPAPAASPPAAIAPAAHSLAYDFGRVAVFPTTAAGAAAAGVWRTAAADAARVAAGAQLAARAASPWRSVVTPVQRLPHGLATEANTTTFVGAAYGFCNADEKRDQPLEELASFLVQRVNEQLPHRCTLEFRPSLGVLGQFDHTTWSIWVNPGRFSKRPGVSTVGALTEAEIAEVVNTVYHEARHAEQNFLVARRRAGQRQTAQQIAAAMHIPLAVAIAAAVAEEGAPLAGQDVTRDAEAWDRSLHGKYVSFEGIVQALERDAEAIKGQAADFSRLQYYAGEAFRAAHRAYKDFLHEKDAFAVGNAAASAYKAYRPTGVAAESAHVAYQPARGAPAPVPTVQEAPTPDAAPDDAPAASVAELIADIRECLTELDAERQMIAATEQEDPLDQEALSSIEAVRTEFLDLLDVYEGKPPRSQPVAVEEETEPDDEAPVDHLMRLMVPLRELRGTSCGSSKLLSTLEEPIDECDGYLVMFQTKSEMTAGQSDPGERERLKHVKVIKLALQAFLKRSEEAKQEVAAAPDTNISLGQQHPLLKAADALYWACFNAQDVPL